MLVLCSSWLKKPSRVMTTPHFVYVTGIQHEGVCRCEPNQPRGAAPHVTGVRTEGQSRGVNEDEEGQPHSGMEGVSPQEHRSLFSAPKLRLPPLLPWTNQQTISPLWSDYPSAPPGSSDGLHSSPSLNRALSPLCLCLRPIKTNPATPLWVRFSTV